jgi:anaerobic selenocysteine-containing dehydrogenase
VHPILPVVMGQRSLVGPVEGDVVSTQPRICHLCEATCGLLVDVEDGRIVAAKGDPDHVLSHGYLCPKGAALPELDNDPDWLDAPRVRRGDGFVEVSWDEAFDEVDRLVTAVVEQHGRDALAVYLGNPNVHNLAGQLYGRVLIKALGTRNVFSASTVDQMPKHRSCAEMFGDPLAIPVPDVDRTDYLVCIGGDPLMSNGSLWTAPGLPRRLRDLRRRGGTLVVVDPRRSRTADLADWHLPIRPGRDPLLLAAMVHVILSEDLVTPRESYGDLGADIARIDEAVAAYSPEAVEDACGLPADDIRRLAREVAAADHAVVYGRIGTTTTSHGTITSWLVDVVNVLTGNLDRPGGAMFPRPAHEDRSGRPPQQFGRWASRVSSHPEVLGEFPAAAIAEEIETPGDGQVRALFVIGGNPVLSTPSGSRLDRALASLDALVSIDPYLTATSRRAHVILPPERPRYRGHADLAFAALAVRNIAAYTPPVAELPAGRMAEWQIMLRLAGIAQGVGTGADIDALDDFAAMAYAGQLVARQTARTGEHTAEELLAIVAPRRGPERILDLLLRSGPYGDAFEGNGDGLSMDRLAEHLHGIDYGALEPRLPDVLLHDRLVLAPEAMLADLPRLQICWTSRRRRSWLGGVTYGPTTRGCTTSKPSQDPLRCARCTFIPRMRSRGS